MVGPRRCNQIFFRGDYFDGKENIVFKQQAITAGLCSNLVRQAITLLLHKPALGSHVVDRKWLKTTDLKGSDILLELLEDCSEHPDISTAGLLEHWRERDAGPHLMKLAGSELLVEDDLLDSEFQDLLQRLILQTGPEKRIDHLVAKAGGDGGLNTGEKSELQELLRAKSLPETSESNE